MKLASLKGGRDGQLVIVSRDLTTAADASDIALTLQSALDEWDVVSPQLAARYEMLNAGQVEGFTFDQAACDSPLPGELAKGFGFVQSKASCAFSPVAVTPDEIDAWDGGTIDLPLLVDYNGVPFGKANVKTDMTFNMPQLVAHAAKTRHLCAGSIIGSGTVSNKFEGGEGKKIEDGGVGYSCIAEIRMIEKIQTGEFITPFMRFGDKVGIEMNDAKGNSIFGRIENHVEKYDG